MTGQPVNQLFKYALLILMGLAIILAAAFVTASVQSKEPDKPASTSYSIGDETTKIVIDTEKDTFHFILDGKEVAVMAAEGLHVYGDMSYNGTIMDGTPEYAMEGKNEK